MEIIQPFAGCLSGQPEPALDVSGLDSDGRRLAAHEDQHGECFDEFDLNRVVINIIKRKKPVTVND